MNTDKMLPLEGIKVVELATVVAAPTAGRMLCAYGAEVIKVENLIGDDLRRAGEFERVVCEDYKNPIFTIQNSGKKLVALNLKSEEGKRAMLMAVQPAHLRRLRLLRGQQLPDPLFLHGPGRQRCVLRLAGHS